MIVLAVDTCLAACSVAVIEGARVLASASEPMERGHQERLAPLTREVVARAGLNFEALDLVGVTVGPGSFTGLRVGLAFAKGLGLALDRPVVGVGTLAALAASAGAAGGATGRVGGGVVAAVDASRGQIYVQAFHDGEASTSPEALTVEDAAERVRAALSGRVLIVGPGAALLAPRMPGASVDGRPAPEPVVVARLAARAPLEPPRPLYLRAPDAKLPG